MRRITKRPQKVENRAETDLGADGADVAHGPVIGGGEQEGDAGLIQGAGLLRDGGVQVDAERGQNTATKLVEPEKIRRVVLCSGKVYYDLLEAREEKGVDDVYLMRLEQFYPWPVKSLSTELSRFPNAELVWCQEEPKNMGGWTFVDPWLELTLDKLDVKAKRARYVGRPGSASTAAGLMSRHLKELEAFTTEAFA